MVVMVMGYDKTLLLDEDGDIDDAALKHNSGILSNEAAVVQELQILLQTVRGEDPFDEEHGFRVFESVSDGNEVLRREIRLALAQDSRVASVPDIRIDSTDIPDEYRRSERSRFVQVVVELVEGEEVELGVGV